MTQFPNGLSIGISLTFGDPEPVEPMVYNGITDDGVGAYVLARMSLFGVRITGQPERFRELAAFCLKLADDAEHDAACIAELEQIRERLAEVERIGGTDGSLEDDREPLALGDAHYFNKHERARRPPPTLNPEYFHIQEDGGGGAIVTCRQCSSDATHWSPTQGWSCSNCGASDSDET